MHVFSFKTWFDKKGNWKIKNKKNHSLFLKNFWEMAKMAFENDIGMQRGRQGSKTHPLLFSLSLSLSLPLDDLFSSLFSLWFWGFPSFSSSSISFSFDQTVSRFWFFCFPLIFVVGSSGFGRRCRICIAISTRRSIMYSRSCWSEILRWESPNF